MDDRAETQRGQERLPQGTDERLARPLLSTTSRGMMLPVAILQPLSSPVGDVVVVYTGPLQPIGQLHRVPPGSRQFIDGRLKRVSCAGVGVELEAMSEQVQQGASRKRNGAKISGRGPGSGPPSYNSTSHGLFCVLERGRGRWEQYGPKNIKVNIVTPPVFAKLVWGNRELRPVVTLKGVDAARVPSLD